MLRTEFYSLLPIPLIVHSLYDIFSSFANVGLVKDLLESGKTAEFLARKAYVLRGEKQDREKRKIPHRQGIREELLEVWEDLVREIYS